MTCGNYVPITRDTFDLFLRELMTRELMSTVKSST